MYEWENEVSQNKIELRKIELRKEISRIANTTLRGNFVNEEDLAFWVKKLNNLTGQLNCLEVAA
jgi:ribosomal protein S15P/S13E